MDKDTMRKEISNEKEWEILDGRKDPMLIKAVTLKAAISKYCQEYLCPKELSVRLGNKYYQIQIRVRHHYIVHGVKDE